MRQDDVKTTPRIGARGPSPDVAAVQVDHCPICGKQPTKTERPIVSHGEVFCSSAHADEFNQAVRSARIQAAAKAPAAASDGAIPGSVWRTRVARVVCWTVPTVALVAMALTLWNGIGWFGGAAVGVLPVLAALACPIGMYFMMRSMSGMGAP